MDIFIGLVGDNEWNLYYTDTGVWILNLLHARWFFNVSGSNMLNFIQHILYGFFQINS